MEILGTTGTANSGSVIRNQQFNSTSTYKQIKASIVSVLMWLSVIGGLL